jgi:hypothetical protein
MNVPGDVEALFQVLAGQEVAAIDAPVVDARALGGQIPVPDRGRVAEEQAAKV